MADAGFAATLPEHVTSDSMTADLMFGSPSQAAEQEHDKAAGDGDTCRICRSEGTAEEPLFHPCKCSGSIKHVHQECLMEWLSHTNKKHCELCKTSFRFTKLYDADMPDSLPFVVFLSQAAVHVAKYCLTWLRAFLVVSIWLVILPWCIRWSWRVVFFMMDAGWAREPWILRLTSAASNASHTTSDILASAARNYSSIVLNGTSDHDTELELGRLPVVMEIMEVVWDILTEPWRWNRHLPSDEVHPILNRTRAAASSSLLSGLDIAHSITASPLLNRAILDVMEGQIITVVVVVVIILVFLIREWVIQQQPILNAAAHVRDAEQELERVEQARQRLRDEIRLVKEQLSQLDNLERGRLSSSASTLDQERVNRSQSLPGLASASRDSVDRFSHFDRAEFGGRIDMVSENWLAANTARSPDSITMIRELTSEALGLLRQAEQDQLSDVETLASLIEWVRRIPPGVDSAWLLDLATEFSQLKPGRQDIPEGSTASEPEPHQIETSTSSSRSSTQAGADGANNETTASERSTTRDSAQVSMQSHTPKGTEDANHEDFDHQVLANDLLRTIRGERDGEVPLAPAHVETGHQSFSRPSENEGASADRTPHTPIDVMDDPSRLVSPTSSSLNNQDRRIQALGSEPNRQSSSDSLDSWQAVQSQGTQPSDRETTSPKPKSADRNEEQASVRITDSSEPVSRAEELPASSSRASSTATAMDSLSLSMGSTTPNGDSTTASGAANGETQQQAALARPGLGHRLYDFFWAGIDLNSLPDDVARAEGDGDLPGEVRIIELEGDDHPERQEAVPADVPVRDPEVVAAAAEAGLDAEAIEEAEDLEGVMELIGMQGPIAVLFQTAFICGGLITLTLWGAVGAPYLFGKLALQLLSDPVLFFVILPLQAITNAGDFLLDLATLLTGGLLHWCLAFMTQILLLFQIRFMFEPAPTYADNLGNASRIAAERAATHLIELFSIDGSAAGTDSYFLLGSLQAHSSLATLKSWVSDAVGHVSSALAGVAKNSLKLQAWTVFNGLRGVVSFLYNDIRRDFVFIRDLAAYVKGGKLFSITLRQSRQLNLDPVLSYWSGKDRTLTICIGYVFLSMAGAAYLLRSEPLFTTPALQRIEKAFSDVLKQAGGVVKVILIISIEMLLFPLYCGVLLDIALLPLFDGVTLDSRVTYASNRPYMFTFLHWFLGTAYMFNFALFVSMCRGILRSGVLYFIRDPDDPTFHPVRDVLERNIATQLRKIAFSAMVYGLMVICCMGGVVWSIAHSKLGVFPLKWSTPDPALEFPIEFIFYNFLSPFMFKYLQPSIGAEAVYEWWLRKCARVLRLSHFLFGERKLDEEGRAKTLDQSKDGVHRMDGSYVRVPASDQVRVVRGQPVFTLVTEEEVTRDDAEQECNQHGRPSQRYRNVYIPPWFRVRIGLFLAGLWTLSASIGVGLTVLPLVLGRGLCSAALPDDVSVSDIWAFALGLHTLLFSSFALFRLPKLSSKLSGKVKDVAQSALGAKLKHGIMCTVKTVYVYGFVLVVIPTLAYVLIHLYMILPVRTYAESMPAPQLSSGISPNPASISALFSGAQNQSAAPASGSGKPALHVIYALPDWTLGFVISRLITSLLPYTRYPLPAAIMRQITRNGRLNPDVGTATRAVVLPTLLICNVALFAPAAFAGLINKVLLPIFLPGGIHLGKAARTKIYRYAYPIFLAHVAALWGTLGVNKAMVKWKGRIKDEVYLVGERLHNFGEHKPPRGSKGIMKKGKEPVAVQQAGEE